MIAKAQLDLLRRRIGGQLPGLEAHERMMPATRKTIYRDITIPDNAKKSATLILLYPSENGLHFPLIERTEYPGVHSKQISFPGGAWEESDPDYIATALREAEEEIGVNRHQIEVIGLLSSLYIPPSNFWVQPVIGYVDRKPDFIADPNEVAAVFPAPLADLLSGTLNGESKIHHSSGIHLTVPSYTIDGRIVWGATAMMISEMVELLGNEKLEMRNE
ncbi:MAG: CoA pyrophosphatase [Bacteroidetes bacterium]|nr:CoA pyrophosphatase [Bacteroidota bacterium]MBL0015280.1 CoA pyrophosphatase [Bacteroidota bacterium]